MKCKSCEEVIPSKFAHAIKTNVCPFCGADIMEAELQSILVNLQILMKEGEPYMEQIEEWLASNYSLRKGAKPKEGGPQSLPSGGIFDEDSFDEETLRRQTEAAKTTINFQKRAGIKGNDMKSLVEKIQSGGGAADPSEFVGEDPDYGHIDMRDEVAGAPLTKKDAAAMMQALNQGPVQSEDPVKEYYEIEKLKKLQRQQPTGQGKFSRGE